jgi:hypothetical protein
MDRHIRTFDQHAKRVFGPSATVAGSIGSERGPGEIRILLDDRIIGTGPTFEAALQAAQRKAAGMAAASRRAG